MQTCFACHKSISRFILYEKNCTFCSEVSARVVPVICMWNRLDMLEECSAHCAGWFFAWRCEYLAYGNIYLVRGETVSTWIGNQELGWWFHCSSENSNYLTSYWKISFFLGHTTTSNIAVRWYFRWIDSQQPCSIQPLHKLSTKNQTTQITRALLTVCCSFSSCLTIICLYRAGGREEHGKVSWSLLLWLAASNLLRNSFNRSWNYFNG